jgi:hypothetical protein
VSRHRLSCPKCKVSLEDGAEFMATEATRGSASYLVMGCTDDGSLIFTPTDYQAEPTGADPQLWCHECGHVWTSRRSFSVQMERY